jgi:hypothetical protein
MHREAVVPSHKQFYWIILGKNLIIVLSTLCQLRVSLKSKFFHAIKKNSEFQQELPI